MEFVLQFCLCAFGAGANGFGVVAVEGSGGFGVVSVRWERGVSGWRWDGKAYYRVGGGLTIAVLPRQSPRLTALLRMAGS